MFFNNSTIVRRHQTLCIVSDYRRKDDSLWGIINHLEFSDRGDYKRTPVSSEARM